jgi:hypothetical protein
VKISKRATLRRTYAAVLAPKRQLICWEESNDESGEGHETPVKQHSMHSHSHHDVVYIQDLSVAAKRARNYDEEAESGLLVVYSDGHVRLFSEDLEKIHWEFVPPLHKSNDPVVYATSASWSTARRGIFKNRSDIITPSGETDGPEDTVLVLLTQSERESNIHFVTVPVIAGKTTPREVLSFQLPGPSVAKSTFSLHIPTGTLYRLSSANLVTYNLAATQPSITTTFPITRAHDVDNHPASLLRISSSTVLVATSEEVSLYDMEFSSLQANVPIQSVRPSSVALSRSSTPASTAGASQTGSIYLSTYIPDIDLALGYAQSGIVGVQFTRLREISTERSGGLLVDSLCRGVKGLEVQSRNQAKGRDALRGVFSGIKTKTEKAIARLRAAKGENNLLDFERAFAEYVGLAFEQQNSRIDDDRPLANGVNGHNSAAARSTHDADSGIDLAFDVPQSAYKPLRTEFVAAVLSMLFAVKGPSSADEEPRLIVSFFAPNVVRYLLESGNFSTLSLPRKEGLVDALYEFDPTLRILQWFFTSLNDLPAPELMSTVEMALSPSTMAPDDENEIIFEIHRAEIVRIALTRLSAFPSSTIIKSLKTLPSNTLLLLIRLLERDLNRNELTAEDAGKSLGIEDIYIVADLLTCALDAVGMSGLVLAESTDLLDGLMSAVDEALATVEQAADLKGLMEEMFRHVDWRSVADSTKPAIPPNTNRTELSDAAILKKREKNARRARYRAEAKALREHSVLETATAAPNTAQWPSPSSPAPNTGLKKAPVMLPDNKNKRRRARASVSAHSAHVARLNNKRAVVGHKKMLQAMPLRKQDVIRQDRPVALSTAQGISPILPLGALALRRLVDPLVGKEFRVDESEGKRDSRMKREYWREGLAAGAYSVESMVV